MTTDAIKPQTELSKRVITGVLGGAALLGLVIFGGFVGIFFLTTLLSMVMIYEFSSIAFSLPDQVEKRYALLLLTWFIAVGNFILAKSEFELLLLSFFVLFSYFLITAQRYTQSEFSTHFKELMYSLFGLMYLVMLPLYLPSIHGGPNGVKWTILFLLMVWAGDTGAYFAGKKFGKNKLYPAISPKKTVEGSVGGLIAGLVIAALFKLLIFRELSWLGVIVTPLLIGLVSQIGDLCESFLKRAFDKKDSGSILPGHGGFLDRFDGVVFSLPIMYACIRIFG